MPPTVLEQLASAMTGHHWLALIAVLSLYVRKIASPASKFPGMPNISPEWLATISATGGLAYGLVDSLQSHVDPGTAAINCFLAAAGSGFFDGVLTAIFAHNSAPNWARFLVGVSDDVGTIGGATKAPVTPAVAQAAAFGVRKDSIKSPPATPLRFTSRGDKWHVVGVVASLVVASGVGAWIAPLFLVACTKPTSAVISPTIDTVVCIIANVAKDVEANETWEQATADTITACGTDAVTIATVWGSHVHAEAVEGFVPKMPVPNLDGGR